MSANDIAQILSNYLSNTLNFVDKFAGLVKPIPYGDKGFMMPFAKCYIGAKTELECNNNPIENFAILEDNHKGIMYFEQGGSVTETTAPSNKPKHSIAFGLSNQQAFNLSLKLVCIVNVRKLGYEDACFEGKLNNALLARLKGNKGVLDTYAQELGIDSLEITSLSFPTLSIQTIFSQYDQNFYKRYEYYPYCYTAINLNLSAVVSENCYQEFELKSELPPC